MFGLYFLHHALLGGLVAGAIPIIVHLMHRKKSRVIPFSTLRFLKSIDRRTARRHRLQEIIVLCLRVATIAILALALARPVLHSRGRPILGRGATSRIFLIDNSLSMGTEEKGMSQLERSKRAVLALIEEMRAEDRGAVIPLHGGALDFSEDPKVLAERVHAIEATYLGTDIPSRVRAAREVMEKETNPVREIYLFSDLQRSGFPTAEKLYEPPLDPEGEIHLYLMSPAPPEARNLTLASVRARVAGGGIPVEVTVRNFGTAEATGRVSIILDGKQDAERAVRVPPGEEREVAAYLTPEKPGLHRGEARLSSDALSGDNRRFFSLRSDERMRLLVVRDRPGRVAFLDVAFYLVRAMRPSGGKGPIEVEPTTTSQIDVIDLSGYDAIYLVDVADLSPEAAGRLRSYVERGGGLCFSSGPTTRPEIFDAPLCTSHPGGVYPAVPGEVVTAGRGFLSLRDVPGEHPIFRPLLSAHPPADVSRARFTRYIRCAPADTEALVVARYSDGGPALIERGIGQGRVLLFTSAFYPVWTDFPLKISFLPFVHATARYLAGGRGGGEEILVGAPIVMQYGPEDRAERCRLTTPSGERREPPVEAGSTRWNLGDADVPGHYIIDEQLAESVRTRILSVNPEVAESNLEPPAAEEIEAMLPGAIPVSFASAEDAVDAARGAAGGSELKNALLALLVLIILLEPWLANSRSMRRVEAVTPEPAPSERTR